MSEDKKDNDLEAPSGEDSSPSADEPMPVAQPSAGTTEKTGRAGQRSGAGPLAWVALLLALASIGLASYPFWSGPLGLAPAQPGGPSQADLDMLDQRLDQSENQASAALEALRADLDEWTARLESSSSSGAAASERIERLSGRLERLDERQSDALGALRDRLAAVEADLGVVQGQSGPREADWGALRERLGMLESELGERLERLETRLSDVDKGLDRADQDLSERLLLIEVDSLFAIAQSHLAVLSDPAAARQVWAQGVDRLDQLAGAEFQDLKQQARRELGLLRRFQPPDALEYVEQLSVMASDVAQWPVRGGPRSEDPGADGSSGTGWRSRFDALLGDLVSVERMDQEFAGPAEIDLAREKVAATLQTAALALVRSRPGLARQLIDQAITHIDRTFDNQSEAVAEARAWLSGIADNEQNFTPPSLNDSREEIARLLGDSR